MYFEEIDVQWRQILRGRKKDAWIKEKVNGEGGFRHYINHAGFTKVFIWGWVIALRVNHFNTDFKGMIIYQLELQITLTLLIFLLLRVFAVATHRLYHRAYLT